MAAVLPTGGAAVNAVVADFADFADFAPAFRNAHGTTLTAHPPLRCARPARMMLVLSAAGSTNLHFAATAKVGATDLPRLNR